MPSVMEDPYGPVKYRVSGATPFLTHLSPLPVEIVPRQVILRDRLTTSTLVPFSAPEQVPSTLLSYVCTLMNREIEDGDTYPMLETFTLEDFAKYWFGNFAAIMILGDAGMVDDVLTATTPPDESFWEKTCLGSFYIKPNYPGRSSHVANGGFLVGPAARNKGVGRLMGEGYLEWAPKLGYTYSVFNLVYETNVASCRIWDALGFKRIGRVKGCGSLKSYPDQLVDAIQYGRDLGNDEEEYQDEDRFEKIRFYLKHGRYPDGADRQEKSRLRSSATHYRLLHGDGTEGSERLMLKDKEVVSDPAKQAELARWAHEIAHAGINKSTAVISEQYHWNGIKSTVTIAIRNCAKCQDKGGEAQGRQVVSKPEINDHAQPSTANTAEQSVEQLSAEHVRNHAPAGYESPTTNTQYDPNFAIDPRLTYNNNHDSRMT